MLNPEAKQDFQYEQVDEHVFSFPYDTIRG